jgi:hypothetical protein
MNERIRELLKQARLDVILNGNGYMENTPYPEIEKFAELIVRECVRESMEEIVSDELIAQEDDPLIREYLKGNNQGIVDAVIRFRNHFGVEE